MILGREYKLVAIIASTILIFTVGTSTDLVNANYKPDLKDVYADNIITVPAVHSFKNLNCLKIAQQNTTAANNKVIAKITGEDAQRILDALEDGYCINFKVAEIPDQEGNELVIELIKLDKNKIEI